MEVSSDRRRRWMGVLAKADPASLAEVVASLPSVPAYQFLRRPEIGLVMLRGRAGGDGACFNLGEMTTTRCSLRLEDGTIGHGYIAGRAPRHAELAALFDALLQDDGRLPDLERRLLRPLEARQAERREVRGRKAAATKVDFFTMVRGGD